ncbi:MAG: 1-acyl-sn-glycerol-3-phosphate acyltransferase [Deltaproteobacteria bacterium]|nr:1-acyl-sn-glycerol-3-phosphate acyltransferase [Deltaproteobacteria bacterium]
MMSAAKIPAQSLAFLRGRLEVLARIPDLAIREAAMTHFMDMVHRIEQQGKSEKLNAVLTQMPAVDYALLNGKAQRLNNLLDTSSNELGRDFSEWAVASPVLRGLKALGDGAAIDEALRRLDFFPEEQRQAMAENPHDLSEQDYLLLLSEPGLRDEPATQQLRAAVEHFYTQLEALKNQAPKAKDKEKSAKENPLDAFERCLVKLESPNGSTPPNGVDYKAELALFQKAMKNFLENPLLARRLQIAKIELNLLRRALLGMPAKQVAERLNSLKENTDSFAVRSQRGKNENEVRTELHRNILALEVYAKEIEKARRKNQTNIAAQGEYEKRLESIIASLGFDFWDSFSGLADTAQLPEAAAALADYAADKRGLLEKTKAAFAAAQEANDAFHADHDAFKQQSFADDFQLQLLQIEGYVGLIPEAEQKIIEAKIARYEALLVRFRGVAYGQGKADGVHYNRLLEASLKALEEIRRDLKRSLPKGTPLGAVSLLSAPYVDKLSKLQGMRKSPAERGKAYWETARALGPLLRVFLPLIPRMSNAEANAANHRTFYRLAQAKLPRIFEATGVSYRGPCEVEHILSREGSIHVMKHSSWWDFLSLAIYIVHMMRGKVGSILGKDGLMNLLPKPIARVLEPYMVPVGSRPHEYDGAVTQVVQMAAEGYPANVFDELTMSVDAEPLGFLGLLPYPPHSSVISLPLGGRSFIIARRQMARTGRMPLHEVSIPLGAWSRMPKPDDFGLHHPAQVITESTVFPSLALSSTGGHSAANWVRTLWLRMGLNPQGWPSLERTSHQRHIVNHRAPSSNDAVEVHLRTLACYPTETRVAAERANLEALRADHAAGRVTAEELALAEQAFAATLELQQQLQPKGIVPRDPPAAGRGRGIAGILSSFGLGAVLMLQGCNLEVPLALGAAALVGGLLALIRGNSSSKTEGTKAVTPSHPIGRTLSAEELPESLQSWAGVRGSGFVSHEPVADSRGLAQAIVQNLRNTLGENATQITGYGSFPLFSKGKNEAIHLRDADKKPDYILVVRDTNEAIASLGRQWNWSPEKIAEMQEHARFSPEGEHQGFTFFNSDILVPGLGPVAFKFSLVSEAAFYHCNEKGRPNLEYAQIRLKDHNPDFALLHSSDRERFLTHLQRVRVAMCEDALISLGNRQSFTGRELGVEFFNASYRREGYRFWEWTKGRELFESRHKLTAALLVEAYRSIAERYSLRILTRTVDGSRYELVSPTQISASNIYDIKFIRTRDLELPRLSKMEFLRFLSRGFWSYIKHGLPGNRVGGAYYVQPNDQYAGRKYRGKLKDRATGQYRTNIGLRDFKVLIQGWLLSHPLMRQIPGLGPILKLIGMDTWRVPVYYPDMKVFINELHANTSSPLHLDSAEHAYLSRFFASDPKLLHRQNAALLMPLVQMISEEEGVARSAAIKLLAHIGRVLPLQEASIRSLMELVNPRDLSETLLSSAAAAAERLAEQALNVFPSIEKIQDFERRTLEATDLRQRDQWQKNLDLCTSQRLSLRLLELDSRLKQELGQNTALRPEVRKSLRRFQRIIQSNQRLLTSVREKLARNEALNLAEQSFLRKAGAVLAGRQNIEGRDHILEQLDWYFRTQDEGSDFNRGLVEKQDAYYALIEGWNERRKNPANPEARQLHPSEDPRFEQCYNDYRIAVETLLNLNGILPESFEGDLFRDIVFRREGDTTIIEPRGWKPSNEFSVRRLARFFWTDTFRGSAGAAYRTIGLVAPEHHQRLYNMVHTTWMYRGLARINTRVVLHGTEKLVEATRPAVILPTHDSGLEFSAVLGILHDYNFFAYYLADEKFLRPPLSWLLRGMREMGHFFVNRKNRAEALKSMVAAGHEIGSSNKSLIAFPGATRNPIRYNEKSEREEGPIYGAKSGALATLDAANEHRPTVGIPMGSIGGGIIYSKETFKSLAKGAAVGREYHVHFGDPIQPEDLQGPNGETTDEARRHAFTAEIDRQFHDLTGRPIAAPAASKDKKASKKGNGGGGMPPSAGISGLSVLALGAMGSILTSFTNTESLGLKALGLGIFVSVAGKEVCDHSFWPKLRQSFVNNARARGVDVSKVDVSGQALAPLVDILRQGGVDFRKNRKILIPNALTASAIVSALGACAASIAHSPLLTSLGLGLAPLLDGIDGTVARKIGASSRTGEWADDFADNVVNGAIVGTLAAAHLANLGYPILGVMVAGAFTLGIRLRLSVFRLISDNPSLKPKEDALGNPHYPPTYSAEGKEISRGFLGVASPVAAMSVLGLYNSVQNSPYLFFGGCMLTAFSLDDWMARGKLGKALSFRRAAAYALPGGALSVYHLLTDTPLDTLHAVVDMGSSAVASFTTAYIAEPYAKAAWRGLRKLISKRLPSPMNGFGE